MILFLIELVIFGGFFGLCFLICLLIKPVIMEMLLVPLGVAILVCLYFDLSFWIGILIFFVSFGIMCYALQNKIIYIIWCVLSSLAIGAPAGIAYSDFLMELAQEYDIAFLMSHSWSPYVHSVIAGIVVAAISFYFHMKNRSDVEDVIE